MDLKVVAGQLTYIERVYVYHYAPGATVLWISLSDWEPPESPLGFIYGEGKPVSTKEIMKRADKYKVRVLVFDGPLPYEAAEEFLNSNYAVVVRYDSPLELPKGAALMMQVNDREAVLEQLKSYDDVHLELYVSEETLLPEVPKDLPVHTFSWFVYSKLLKRGLHYVYNHVQPLREDTKCPACGTPNAVREEGMLLGWDGPKCRKCGYAMHYHVFEVPEPPTSVREWLSWRSSVPVL